MPKKQSKKKFSLKSKLSEDKYKSLIEKNKKENIKKR